MKLFIKDLKKYIRYSMYSAKSELKSEVSSSYLNWLWWLLDPILFMLVYTFIVQIVFNSREAYFPVFVFIGLTMWNFFNKDMLTSVKLVKSNKSIVTKIYIPKYVLLITKMFVNLFKMLISLGLVFILIVAFKVPFSINIIHIIPIIIVLWVVTFGCGTILMHFGVFIDDLSNVTTVLLRLAFYMSGIFYSISGRVPKPYSDIILKCNPIAYAIDEMRQVLLFQHVPDYRMVALWFVVGIIISAIGVSLIYKYENSYAKVI